MRLHSRHGGVVGALEVQYGRVERIVVLVKLRLVEVEGGEAVRVLRRALKALRLQEGVGGDVAVGLGRHDGRLLQLLLVGEVAVCAAEVETGLLLVVGGEARVAKGVWICLRAEAVVVVLCEGVITTSKGSVELRVVRRGGVLAAYMVGLPSGRRSAALAAGHCGHARTVARVLGRLL